MRIISLDFKCDCIVLLEKRISFSGERRKGKIMADLKYLNRLAKDYPNIKAASAEIINLKAILALPKGTEYFLSDLHGEDVYKRQV